MFLNQPFSHTYGHLEKYRPVVAMLHPSTSLSKIESRDGISTQVTFFNEGATILFHWGTLLNRTQREYFEVPL